MPYDPNADPRTGMSSGGPGPAQPTQPAQPTNPLFTPGSNPYGGGTPTNTTGIGYDPGQMQPGDHTGGFFGGLVHDINNSGIFGSGPAGNVMNAFDLTNRGYPDLAGAALGGGGGGGGAPMVTPGGAPQIPGMDAYGGSGGGVGQLEGLDMTKPGALEQYQREHAGYFGQPTMSEMFAKDAIARGGGPAPTNRAEEAYQQFNSSNPANMDPYYANERRKAEEAIRRTMSARGSYGSSAADDLYNEMNTNLAADAAKANAQYGLQRGGLLGSLAQGADSSSLSGSADRRNWTSTLGSLAGQGDVQGLNRVTGGANIAGAAQGAQRARGQDAFSNQLMMGDRMSGIMGQGYGNIFGTDLDLMKTITGLNTGTAAEGYNQGSQNAMLARQDVGNFNNLLGGNTQYFQGLSDMFKGPTSPTSPAPSPMPQGYVGPSSFDNYGTTNWYQP